MITPRSTRLVRVPDLRTFRDAIAALACEGDPLAARDRLVVVPTRAAALHLTRSIEDRRLGSGDALLLPDVVSREGLHVRLASRLADPPRMLTPFEREALLGVACRSASAAGHAPPFSLRPGLVAAMLAFYDDLRRNENDAESFLRRVLDILEPGADADRGAERLVRQTRFLAAAFADFESRCRATGAVDEHGLRALLAVAQPSRPWRHVVVTVADRAADTHGLWTCDFDLLARLHGLERIDVVITDTRLAGALHERIHRLLPGIEEHRFEATPASALVAQPFRAAIAPSQPTAVVYRDREEEVAGFAVLVRQIVRDEGPRPLERMALVVRRPLPYVYLARDVLRSAGVPCQMFDTLPLAAEPYAAALDLVFTCVSSNFARVPLIALLQSPHFRFEKDGRRLAVHDVAALDRALSDAGYLGDVSVLEPLAREWPATAALEVARELDALRSARPVAEHASRLMAFLARHDVLPAPADPFRARHLRARAAVLGALEGIRIAHGTHDDAAAEFEAVAAMVRRWVEGQTFAPRAGETGVHLVDADSAPYGDFEVVQLAGLVEGEWPDRPRRSIFYSNAVLQQLGWPPEKIRLEGERNAFSDLLRLPSDRAFVTSFTLEHDAVVSVSPLLDSLEPLCGQAGEERGSDARGVAPRIFLWEALGIEPARPDLLPASAARWGAFRLQAAPVRDARHRGATRGHAAPAFAVSAIERYQDCPFRFFAADVLRLEEAPEDEPMLSPRARGRFIHEVFQRFFEAWDARAGGTIDADRMDEARALFETVARPLLERLPESEAALVRARLFGSAIAPGVVEVVLGIEASRPVPVVERWLEHRFDGEFGLGATDGRRASLRGVADRVDLLEGRRLRIVDYKSGSAPNVKRALQVAIYALCAAERLEERDGEPCSVDEAAYVAFSGKRALVPVVRPNSDAGAALDDARRRLFGALDGIGRGEFPPRPFDASICTWCAYPSVCRKDYVGDE